MLKFGSKKVWAAARKEDEVEELDEGVFFWFFFFFRLFFLFPRKTFLAWCFPHVISL